MPHCLRMSIVTNPEGLRIALVDNLDARRDQLISAVLEAFQDMGAVEEQMVEEEIRLERDANYFRRWVVSLPDWNPGKGVLVRMQNTGSSNE